VAGTHVRTPSTAAHVNSKDKSRQDEALARIERTRMESLKKQWSFLNGQWSIVI